MSAMETGEHLTDAELVRYLDDDAGTDEAVRFDGHVAECPRCDDALRTVRDESRLVSEWLERAAFEANGPTIHPVAASSTGRLPGRSTVAPWLRAAALFVLLAAPLAAFPGVRAWVAERVVGTSPAATDHASASATESSTVLRFLPAPGAFVVRFDPDTEGVITIERSVEPEAELRAEGGEPEATVSASLLRIRNTEAARYRLRLPEATTGVWVMAGERAVAVSERQIDRRTAVELGG